MRRLIPQVSALAVLVMLVPVLDGCGRQTGPTRESAPAQQAELGRSAPDFSFTTVDGETISLAALRGKPVLLNFWASWCHFCIEEAPHLEALYQQYEQNDLQVLGVGTDSQDALRRKAEELKLTYPVGSNPEAAGMYGVSGIPHTFFIDRDGKLVSSVVGARPRADLEAEVKRIL